MALYATNTINKNISCLTITLSTPFIYLKNRKNFKRLHFANYKSTIFLSWFLWIVCLLSYLFSSHFLIIMYISMIIFSLSIINQLIFAYSKIRSELLLDRVPIINTNNSIVVYESPSDEAIFILNVSSLLQKMSLNIYHRFTNKMAKYYILVRSIHRKHYKKYTRKETKEPYSIFSNPLNTWRILGLFVLIKLITIDKKIDTFDIFIFMSPFFMEFARVLIGVFFSLVASIFMITAISVIGRDEALSAPTLEFAVSSSPTGKSTLRSFPYSGFDNLSHSSLYSQNSVINSIASDINDWVQGVM